MAARRRGMVMMEYCSIPYRLLRDAAEEVDEPSTRVGVDREVGPGVVVEGDADTGRAHPTVDDLVVWFGRRVVAHRQHDRSVELAGTIVHGDVRREVDLELALHQPGTTHTGTRDDDGRDAEMGTDERPCCTGTRARDSHGSGKLESSCP